MVRKTNSGRVWQNKKHNVQHQQSPALNQENDEQNKIEQGLQSQESKEDVKMSEKINSKSDFQGTQQGYLDKHGERQKDKQMNTLFRVTSELISVLNEKVYKEIVLPEFIQTSLNPQNLANENSFNQSPLQFQTSSFTVRSLQNQQITNFLFGPSLQLPSYLKPFKINSISSNNLSEIEKPQGKLLEIPWKKHKALSFVNSALLELSEIKYLNIYGPTGSGKTFTLNSIINSKKITQNVIWINGMNIVSGKTKKFISDLKSKFDNTFWQFYNEQSAKEAFSLEKFTLSCFSKRNEKVLILDEYDQINDFELKDLLRYAYIKGFENYPTNKRKLFRISKVIFVSNSFEPTQSFMQKEQNLISVKNLYMQNLIFKPFTLKQAETILLQKIRHVNKKFISKYGESNEIKEIFQSEMKGIFQDQYLMHIIKKVSISQQIDIRKILQFYANSIKKWIESLDQIIYGSFMKKVESFLVDKKFLQNCSFHVSVPSNPNSQSQDDSNPLFFYLSQIENEGKSILRAICEILKFKKRLLGIETLKSVKRGRKEFVQNRLESDVSSLMASQRRKQNTVRIMDFFGKIRPKIQLYQIYPWLYEWQEMGLVKIKKGITEKSLEAEVKIGSSNKIKITDNFLIEVLDTKTIQEGLNLYY